MRLSSAVLLFALAWASPSTPILTDGSHCVAYRVEKVSFFLSSSDVIGKNCDISAQVLPEVGGLYHIEVNVPLRSFKSGDEDRDKDVQKILKADERPELTFRSKAMSEKDWHTLFAKKNFEIAGELMIGEKTFPITLSAKYAENAESAEVNGVGKVRFEDLDMKPPKVAGGVVAKADSDIELHFHLMSHRILGADSIRLGAEKDKQ